VPVLCHSLFDRYRCPQGFTSFDLDGQLSIHEGYFRFGSQSIGYGRTSSGSLQERPDIALDDLLRLVRVQNGKLIFPFDPDEILDNLRLELYLHGEEREDQLRRILKRVYYLLRPLMNISTRRIIQRFYARNWSKRNFPKFPVDTTVESFVEELMLLFVRAKDVETVPFIWFWPRGAHGCITMTHDVETKSGVDFCQSLMDLDEAAGIKAIFNLVPEKRYAIPFELIKLIRERGFEVGIQDLNHDGKLFDSHDEFLVRAQRINSYARQFGARGFRSAVLYRKPEWFDALDFSFDMSMPNVAHLDPQRGGCCTIMPYFIGDTLEIPVTTTQDYTLFHILDENSINLWKVQMEIIMAKNGLISFIIHPDYVIESKYRTLFKELLTHIRLLADTQFLWVALPSEIDKWWRARSKMTIVPDQHGCRVSGEYSEDAVIAYARIDRGKLLYEFTETKHMQVL
jgi:hypothetical protein